MQANMERTLKEQIRTRFWVESALALVCSILTLVTIIRKDWIEAAFGLDPDHGSGAMEWEIVFMAIALTVAFVTLALCERARRQTIIA